ncbi:MAG TPA: enoyl-CoA hydratase-related protein [bacterium]|nr:enoyl-CoA hydratase-related protein [bacterium]
MPLLEIEKRDGWAVVRLRNPERRNALSRAVLAELGKAFDALEADPSVRAAVVTGEGKSFAAGADLCEMLGLTPSGAREFARYGRENLDRIERSRVVTVAAVNGHALGGGLELALACDVRICSEGAKFGQPGLKLGVIPGWGGTDRLARVVGLGRAKAMLFTGEPLNAESALAWGLVSAVHPPERLMEKAGGLAGRIATLGPVALAQVKRQLGSPGGETELDAFAECFASGEAAEGMGAFLEKRKPNWN